MSKYEGWRPVRFDDVVPGMKKSNWAILIWTGIYLLNLVLVFVFQGVIYDLPYEETNNLIWDIHNGRVESDADLFPDCQLLDAYSDFFLLRDSEGNLKIAVLKQNDITRNYKIKETIPVPEGQEVAVNLETQWQKYTLRILDGSRIDWDNSITEENRDLGAVFWRSMISGNGLTAVLLIAVVMLLIEYGFYCQLQKLRE